MKLWCWCNNYKGRAATRHHANLREPSFNLRFKLDWVGRCCGGVGQPLKMSFWFLRWIQYPGRARELGTERERKRWFDGRQTEVNLDIIPARNYTPSVCQSPVQLSILPSCWNLSFASENSAYYEIIAAIQIRFLGTEKCSNANGNITLHIAYLQNTKNTIFALNELELAFLSLFKY